MSTLPAPHWELRCCKAQERGETAPFPSKSLPGSRSPTTTQSPPALGGSHPSTWVSTNDSNNSQHTGKHMRGLMHGPALAPLLLFIPGLLPAEAVFMERLRPGRLPAGSSDGLQPRPGWHDTRSAFARETAPETCWIP